MHLLDWIKPTFALQQIRQIDQQAAHELAQADGHEKARVWILFAAACLCLLLVHYGKYSSNLKDLLFWLDRDWGHAWQKSQYRELWGYLWWSGINLLGFLLIPMLVIRFGLKDKLSNYGWQWGTVSQHWPGYLLLALPIMGFAIIASFGDDFSRHYPFYKRASRSWFDLLTWECLYIAQFVAVEFFFRGFLVNGLKRLFGSFSVAIMCLPYLMLHFPKLWPESFGAILFGFYLGVLALMSSSIFGGVMVHVSIALTMDLAALIQTKGLPEHW